MKTEEFIAGYEKLDEAGKRQIDEHLTQLIQSRQIQSPNLARVIEALNRIQLSEAELDEWENSLNQGWKNWKIETF